MSNLWNKMFHNLIFSYDSIFMIRSYMDKNNSFLVFLSYIENDKLLEVKLTIRLTIRWWSMQKMAT